MDARRGLLCAEFTNAEGNGLPGISLADMEPYHANGLDIPLRWRRDVTELRGTAVRLRVHLRDARLYAVTFRA